MHYQRQKPKANKHPQKSHLQSYCVHSIPECERQNPTTSNQNNPCFVERHFVYTVRVVDEGLGESSLVGPRGITSSEQIAAWRISEGL